MRKCYKTIVRLYTCLSARSLVRIGGGGGGGCALTYTLSTLSYCCTLFAWYPDDCFFCVLDWCLCTCIVVSL